MSKRRWGGYYTKDKDKSLVQKFNRHTEDNRKAMEMASKFDVPRYPIEEITHQRPSLTLLEAF